MWLSLCRLSIGLFACVLVATPANAGARELATVQGAITIRDARPGLRAPSCSELVVEARDALDNHLIAETVPTVDEAGACRYAVSVPAQMAVWLRLQPLLVAGVRVVTSGSTNVGGAKSTQPSSNSVALRFTLVSPTTYFFTPNERKTIPLSY
jgi:hypothetical protein